jgi:hypothetical protein
MKVNDSEKLGDEPIEDAYLLMMNQLAEAIDELFNQGAKGPDRKVGFILMVFPFSEQGGRCNYISNGAARKDVVALFKEQIARFEGMPSGEGRA